MDAFTDKTPDERMRDAGGTEEYFGPSNGRPTGSELPPLDDNGAPRGRRAFDAEPAFFDPWQELAPVAFPIHALPAVIGDFVGDRSRTIGADIGALAWSAIGACSSALNPSARLQMKRKDRWSVPPHLWIALVGEPSAKKTPIIDATWQPILDAQNAGMPAWLEAHRQWEELPAKEKKKTQPPRQPDRYVLHDATPEAIQMVLSNQGRGLSILRDELAGFIGGLEKYSSGNASAADRAFFLQAHQASPYTVDRISRGTIHIRCLALGIMGGVQPGRLRQLGDLTCDGMWQRFIPIIVPAADEGDDNPDPHATHAYDQMVRGLLQVPGTLHARFDEGAHEVGQDVGHRLHEIQRSDLLGAAFSAHVGKLHGMWGRLALILSQVDPGHVRHVVPPRIAEAARTLILESALPNAARIYAAMGAKAGQTDTTKAVARYILTRAKGRLLSSELARDLRPCRGASLQDIQAIVSPLVAGGWLIPEAEFHPNSWRVHIAVHPHFARQAELEKSRREAIRVALTGVSQLEDVE